MSDRRLLNCESACAIPPSRQHPARWFSPWRFHEAARLWRRPDVAPPPPGVASFVRLNNAQTQDQKNAFAIPTREAHVRVRAASRCFLLLFAGSKKRSSGSFRPLPKQTRGGGGPDMAFFFGGPTALPLPPSPQLHCSAPRWTGLDVLYIGLRAAAAWGRMHRDTPA